MNDLRYGGSNDPRYGGNNDLRFNAEMYLDLTAFGGIRAADAEIDSVMLMKMGYRPVVYICSPYAGDIERNVVAACKYSKFAVDEKYIPVTPHLMYTRFMDDSDPEQRELGLRMGFVLLRRCEQLWVFGDHISEGMRREIRQAYKLRRPIRRFTTDCREVQRC